MSCTDFVNNQLSICAQHEDCGPQAATDLPKRLVQIDPKIDKVWLVTNEGATGQYAALSYCWGTAQGVLKTTTENLPVHQNDIPWDQVPKTIRDAIIISRTIGIFYLWIDSLCIIQNDKDDWETEAAKMGDYYSNALLTIGASSAASATEGMFAERELWYPATTTIYVDQSGRNHDLLVQRRPYLASFEASEMGPIGTRGWTVQENALSRRMVHFTKIGLFWECRQAVVSENGHPILQNAGDVSLIRQFQQEFEWDFALSWHTFVEMYTLRSLTYIKDQLPAIAGIASRLHSRTGNQYRAGLWEAYIGLNLTWRVACDATESKELLPGPSWSWTSIGSPVQFPEELWAHDKVLCHLEQHASPTQSQKSFVAAGEQRLRLNGPLQEAVLTSKARELISSGARTDANSSKPQCTLSLSNSEEEKYVNLSINFSPDTRLEATSVTDESGNSFQTVQRSTQPLEPFRLNVFCLWCVQQPPENREAGFEHELVGIVLGRLAGNMYCRVGLVSLLGIPDRTDQLESMRKTITLM